MLLHHSCVLGTFYRCCAPLHYNCADVAIDGRINADFLFSKDVFLLLSGDSSAVWNGNETGGRAALSYESSEIVISAAATERAN